MNRRDVPNLLGLFRIITTPLLVWLMAIATPWGDLAASMLLLLMAISDIVDGRISRKLKVVSALGVFLDTISDKIFVAGALIPMVERGILPGWIAALIIIREFAVSGLRSYAAAEGTVIAARGWGKQKLIFTVMAIIWRLVDTAIGQNTQVFEPLRILASLWPAPMAIAIALTVISGVEYFWKAWPLLRKPVVNSK